MSDPADNGQDSTFVEWKSAFHSYVRKNDLFKVFTYINNELSAIGWPKSDSISDLSPQQQKEEISLCSSNLVRLQKVHYDLRSHQVNLDRFYKFMFFLRTQEGETLKGKTKEEKRNYAELDLHKEKNLIKTIETFLEQIENLNQAYKSRYNGISRIHSIVTFELEMSK